MAYYSNNKNGTRGKCWRATVQINNQRWYLGYFATKEEAEAYEKRFRQEMIEEADYLWRANG